MNVRTTFLAVAICGVAIVGGLLMLARVTPPARTDTVVIQRSARAESVAVRTVRTVTRDRVFFDSVFRTDTLRDTIVRVRVESLLVQCERCGLELAAFRQFADSVRKSDRDTIARLRRELASCQKQKPWYAAAGFGGCAVLTGVLR